jgi:hypothetical protein
LAVELVHYVLARRVSANRDDEWKKRKHCDHAATKLVRQHCFTSVGTITFGERGELFYFGPEV